jgi:hypothetical protein
MARGYRWNRVIDHDESVSDKTWTQRTPFVSFVFDPLFPVRLRIP